MADKLDTIIDEMIDEGFDYHHAMRLHRERMANDPEYRTMIDSDN